MKKTKRGLAFLLASVMASTMVLSPLGFGAETVMAAEDVAPAPIMPESALEGYSLKWQDEFEGTELNRADWNVELHEPGWVNAELQAYVDSDENIKVADGNLIIQPKKDGDSYTSGRVNTQGKHDFKYGVFEARAKVPAGMGYLPAFWMMPTDENLYGQWPRCGEIDCMEVMGQDPTKAYGTVHFGNPHAERQGTYTMSNAAENYHTYTCEWEPGKITWYIDGIKYHETNDWYTATEGQGTITYPAPFDQPFYMILNLAIGGSWVGYPDENTTYDDQSFAIDYVRVWQKDSSVYEEAEKVAMPPVKEIVLKTPDANGNYITNGDFAVAEDLIAAEDWQFMTALGGEASASIANNEIAIDTVNQGTVDYSVQLVQAGLPLEKGATYELSFDAKASADRHTNFAVKAPDRGWKAYVSEDVALTTDYQTYTYTYKMTDATDANARLEFNMGKAGSTASIYVTNVKVVKTAEADPNEVDAKVVLADGNFIYNGSFQEGTGRTQYWSFSDDMTKSVTSLSDGRRLKAEAVAGSFVTQDAIAVVPQATYALSFDAEAFDGASIDVTVAGVTKTFSLGANKTVYNDTFVLPETLENRDVKITFNNEGTYYLDNIRLVEDSLFKNGSFNAGLAGYEVYVDGSASATCVVDSLSEDNAADFTINNTADQDWKIQLKQNNVLLKEEQCYKLSFDIKSSIDRSFVYAIQRNGAVHKDANGNEDWQPYVQESVELSAYGENGEYTHIENFFKMSFGTDAGSIFNIALGGGNNTTQHRVCIDNIELVEISEDEMPGEALTPKPYDTNLLVNADFANGLEGWAETIANWGGDYVTDASSAISDGKVVYTINNPGTDDWHVQLKQSGVQLEAGQTYRVTFNASSTETRTMKSGLLSATYAWYGGEDTLLPANESVAVDYTFTMASDDPAADFFLSMGKIAGEDTPGSIITITDISLIKVGADVVDPEPEVPSEPEVPEIPRDTNLLANADFANGLDSWTETIANWGGDYVTDASIAIDNGTITYTINNPGTDSWHVQLKQQNICLEKGETYVISFDATTTVDRAIMMGLQADAPSYAFYGGVDSLELVAGKVNKVRHEFTYDKDTDANAVFYLSLGKLAGVDTPAATLSFSNLSVMKHTHNLIKHEAVEATYDAEGNTEYYSCSCGVFYADAEGTVVVEEGSWVTPKVERPVHNHKYVKKVVKATILTDGFSYEKCECGKIINKTVIKAVGSIKVDTKATYTGKAIKPIVTIKDRCGNVISESNYTVTYLKNVKVGTAFVTVTFKESYAGVVVKTFCIVPQGTSLTKTTAGKDSMSLTWKKQTVQTDGYVIQYSKDKNFETGVKSVIVANNKTTEKKISGLSKDSKYYARVCTYKGIYKSEWSTVKTLTTKKK